MLKIYNSLTQQKEIFQPREPKTVKIYVCGPTVYDYAHIGNARTYAAFDVVVRYLRWRGHQVTYVRNITDIDDKIIKRANDAGEPFQSIVNRFTQAAHEDFAALDLLKPDHEPRATDYISNIIKLIERLMVNQCAYIAPNGDVYYEVRQFKPYGTLSHHDIEQLESGARVALNTDKRDPLDFVLWKLAKPNEPSWDSPWGAGRPGWHIECSAMSMALLGEQFDIHGGGKDLIFPHHENEMAQSEAATGKIFVNYWLHTGYLQIEKEKMSKSLGNFLTIRDVLKQYPAEVLRYFLIASHYRSPVHYSASSLTQAQLGLERFYIALNDLPDVKPSANTVFEEQFITAMDDDFNVPVALAVLFDLAREINRLRREDRLNAASHAALLKILGGALGILQTGPRDFLQANREKLDVPAIERLIQARNEARGQKNWALADRIRKELANQSIVLEDEGQTTTWKFTGKVNNDNVT